MDTDDDKVRPHNDFVAQLDELLMAKRSDEAYAFMQDEENQSKIASNCTELIPTVMQYLTEKNLAQNPQLHNICENILINIATQGNETDVVLGLVEVVQTTESDNTIVSVMKAMQAYLMKQIELRPLEWMLDSIQEYASELPLSEQLRNALDDEEEKLLENEEEVRRIVCFYIFMRNFYDPILDTVMKADTPNDGYFFNYGQTRRNVLTCFLIQLFGVPFSYLDLSDPVPNIPTKHVTQTNLYTRQCVTSLSKHVSDLVVNPLRLIVYGHRRKLWPYVFTESDDPEKYSKIPSDIFVLPAKISMTALSVMFYALFVENLFEPNIPKIYRPVYLLEMGLYYATELLSSDEETLRTKGLRLAAKLIENLHGEQLDDDTIELDIHKDFMKNLIKVLDSTQVKRNSTVGIQLLNCYLNTFKTTTPKYFHIYHLLETTTNNKIRGLLVTTYKNIIANQLNSPDPNAISELQKFCGGYKMEWLLLNQICVMPKGVETDILTNNDKIMAALNMLRFLVIRDKQNVTGIWDCIGAIEERFLTTLRTALECSRAHYRLEEKRLREEKPANIECDVAVAGCSYDYMPKENQLQALAIGQNTFDLIDNVLSHLTESIESHNRK